MLGAYFKRLDLADFQKIKSDLTIEGIKFWKMTF